MCLDCIDLLFQFMYGLAEEACCLVNDFDLFLHFLDCLVKEIGLITYIGNFGFQMIDALGEFAGLLVDDFNFLFQLVNGIAKKSGLFSDDVKPAAETLEPGTKNDAGPNGCHRREYGHHQRDGHNGFYF